MIVLSVQQALQEIALTQKMILQKQVWLFAVNRYD